MGVAPAVGGTPGSFRTVAFVGEPPRNPAEERDVTQNDPVVPGATAPGSTPGSAVITGDARVDQALRQLGELDDLPLTKHAAVFEHIHGELTGALGTLDSGNDQFPQAPIAPSQNRPAPIMPAAAADGTPATPDS
jgi:hypothetical protein